MQPLISVIVPVYNVDKYLNQCLDSLVSQDFDDFEIILIDDGSTDQSKSICMKYEIEFSFVHLYSQENKGVVMAIQQGISIAHGKYLAFVDADDWIEEIYLSTLYETAITTQADLVYAYAYTENNESQSTKQPLRLKPGVYNRDEILSSIIPESIASLKKDGLRIIGDSRWGKLFKSSIVKQNQKYNEKNVIIGEDHLFILPIIFDSEIIAVPDNYAYLYHWRFVEGSLSHRYIKNLADNYSIIIGKFNQIIEDKHILNVKDRIEKYSLDAVISCLKNEMRFPLTSVYSETRLTLQYIADCLLPTDTSLKRYFISFSFIRYLTLLLIKWRSFFIITLLIQSTRKRFYEKYRSLSVVSRSFK